MKSTKETILITGATGHLGSNTINFLLEKIEPSQVIALVRDESKASGLKEKEVDIRIGNYDDIVSLDKSMEGVTKVLLVAGTDEENRLQQHKNVIDAAKKAGVKFIAYTSRTLKDRDTIVNKLMEGHFQTEDYIKESGLNYAIFRNVLYMDAIPQFVGAKVFETGIFLPAGQGKVPFAVRQEMAEAIANVLISDIDGNKIYNFTASQSYSFDDIALTLTELSGKNVKYISPDKSVFESKMKERGLPELIIQKITGFLTDIKNGQEDEISADLENLLGRKPKSLKEGLKSFYNL
ncbi:SDR family oxidoreductase [bacterium]|nr:MAG: SDR family oxidoreductase [bacterium]